jgi:hypothetical protein
MIVILDTCAVDRLAESGVNPVADLESTEFRLAYTPDLKLEYERALTAAASTSRQARDLIKTILAAGTLVGFFGFDGGPCLGFDRGIWADQEQCDVIASLKVSQNNRGLPRKRTDAHLVALGRDAIVITANSKEAHWKRSINGSGRVIQWDRLREILKKEHNLAAGIRTLLAPECVSVPPKQPKRDAR